MKTPGFGGSLWLLGLGSATIVLFAAFSPSGRSNAPADLVETSAEAAPLPPDPASDSPEGSSPAMTQIIKMAQAHVGNDVLLAYIQNSGKTYQPTADDLIYLRGLGVSDNVVSALYPEPAAATSAPTAPTAPPVTATIAPPPVPAPTPAPPASFTINANYYYNDAPPAPYYSDWPETPNYNTGCQPSVFILNSGGYFPVGRWPLSSIHNSLRPIHSWPSHGSSIFSQSFSSHRSFESPRAEFHGEPMVFAHNSFSSGGGSKSIGSSKSGK